MEVRRKAITIVLSMTSSRNVEEVVLFFKKQLQKTQETDFDKAPEYRQLLIQSIHITAVKFAEVAASVVLALMDFLGDTNNPSALDVVAFVREVVEKFPNLRTSICDKLISTLPEVKSGKVFRGILWILGEYVENVASINGTMHELRKVIGEVPILASEQRLLDEASAGDEEKEEKEEKPKESTKPKVLADGTYATETAFTSASTARLEAVKAASKPPLRSMTHSSFSLNFADWFCSTHSGRRFLHCNGPRLCLDQACLAIRGIVQRHRCLQRSARRGVSYHSLKSSVLNTTFRPCLL